MKTAVEGTENQIVMPSRRMNPPGLISSFVEGQHRQAPASQVTNMSHTDTSNVSSWVWEMRSSSVSS